MMTVEKPLRDIVTENFNSAEIFEKYGLDFCCKGGMSLESACIARGIDFEQVSKELQEVTYDESSQRFFRWDVSFLIDYIINNHHSFVRERVPLLLAHLHKISDVHGSRHPEFLEVESLFQKVSNDLLQHMFKEERILFPAIKMIAQAATSGQAVPPLPFGSIRNPIAMMIADHETAGDELQEIRRLVNDYTPPDDACTTVRVTFEELRDFESDLHRHVFLENSVLFPKASQLEKDVLTRN